MCFGKVDWTSSLLVYFAITKNHQLVQNSIYCSITLIIMQFSQCWKTHD